LIAFIKVPFLYLVFKKAIGLYTVMSIFFFSLYFIPTRSNTPIRSFLTDALAVKAYAATSETPKSDNFDITNTLNETLDYLEKTVDEFHETASKRILAQSNRVDMNTANWLDNFFSERRTAIEENKTHLKVKTRLFIQEGEGTDFDFKFNLKLVLPKTKNKVHFSLTRNDGDDTGIDRTLADDATSRYEKEGRDEGVTASLRYFLKDTDTRNISMRMGIRFSGITPVLVFEPRYRQDIPLDPWMLRFTHFFKWYTDRGLASNSRFDLERPLFENFFSGYPRMHPGMKTMTAGSSTSIFRCLKFCPINGRSITS